MPRPKTANERLIERIDAVAERLHEGKYSADDASVLEYIRSQMTPSGLAKRAEDPHQDNSVTHLHEVANMRLKPYESTKEHDTTDD